MTTLTETSCCWPHAQPQVFTACKQEPHSSDPRTVQELSALDGLGGGEELPQACKRMKLSEMNMAFDRVQHKVRQTFRYGPAQCGSQQCESYGPRDEVRVLL